MHTHQPPSALPALQPCLAAERHSVPGFIRSLIVAAVPNAMSTVPHGWQQVFREFPAVDNYPDALHNMVLGTETCTPDSASPRNKPTISPPIQKSFLPPSPLVIQDETIPVEVKITALRMATPSSNRRGGRSTGDSTFTFAPDRTPRADTNLGRYWSKLKPPFSTLTRQRRK